MQEYEVIYEGMVRFTYAVKAESEEEARNKFRHGDMVFQETLDGEVVEVLPVED